MKVYAIRDAFLDDRRDLAWLIWYEKEQKFIIEISEKTDSWSAPFMLASFVEKGIHTVNSFWSLNWVRERIVPEERQNLGMILKANGLAEYDPHELLRIAGGRCAQDDCFITALKNNQIPDELRRRLGRRAVDTFSTSGGDFVLFRNGKIIILESSRKGEPDQRIKAYEETIERIRLCAEGHEAQLSDGELMTAEEIRRNGTPLPFSMEDLREFLRENLMNTAQTAEALGCTRQNIQDLVLRGKLKPVMKEKGGFVFLKADITAALP